MLENAYLVPLIPALSFVLILAAGKRIRGGSGAHLIGVPAVGASWVLSLVVAYQWVQRSEDAAGAGHGDDDEHARTVLDGMPAVLARAGDAVHAVAEPVTSSITWWSNGGVEFEVGTLVDGLSALLLVVVTTVSLLVHVYSTEYVKDDVRYTHFFAFLSLFTASMLFFVLADNLVMMLVGWELVGVCSFVLIGHWWEERPNSDAALKAFFTNRVGDVGLIVGVIVLFWSTGTFSIAEINTLIAEHEVGHLVLLVTALCLTSAVMSKSGQFPLHTWLPDAMAGPTPVSALIHAATMVVAGVYMVARLYPVFFEGYSIGTSGINLLAFIGGFTALIGAGLAFVQWDIKKVLAYSTVSQLGYMILALGVGAWTAAIFHLFTHAFFKACLFLGAGSVSHAAHHTFDMREMGGLRKHMPHTYATFVIGTLALAGIFPLAGFWSKDEILVGAFDGPGSTYWVPLFFGGAVALMTAAYMARVVWYTFHGEYRGHGHPHESPRLMTVPLWILAAMAVLGGLFNLPQPVADVIPGMGNLAHRVETYAEPVQWLEELEGWTVAAPSLSIALIGLALAATGLLIAYLWFWKDVGPHGLTQRNVVARGAYAFLENRYYLDHLYTNVIVAGIKGPIARAAYWINQHIIDRVVDGAGEGARDGGRLLYRYIDQGVVDGVVNATGEGAEASGEGLRAIQSGRVQQYGALLFGAAAVLALVFVIVL